MGAWRERRPLRAAVERVRPPDPLASRRVGRPRRRHLGGDSLADTAIASAASTSRSSDVLPDRIRVASTPPGPTACAVRRLPRHERERRPGPARNCRSCSSLSSSPGSGAVHVTSAEPSGTRVTRMSHAHCGDSVRTSRSARCAGPRAAGTRKLASPRIIPPSTSTWRTWQGETPTFVSAQTRSRWTLPTALTSTFASLSLTSLLFLAALFCATAMTAPTAAITAETDPTTVRASTVPTVPTGGAS